MCCLRVGVWLARARTRVAVLGDSMPKTESMAFVSTPSTWQGTRALSRFCTQQRPLSQYYSGCSFIARRPQLKWATMSISSGVVSDSVDDVVQQQQQQQQGQQGQQHREGHQTIPATGNAATSVRNRSRRNDGAGTPRPHVVLTKSVENFHSRAFVEKVRLWHDEYLL